MFDPGRVSGSESRFFHDLRDFFFVDVLDNQAVVPNRTDTDESLLIFQWYSLMVVVPIPNFLSACK